MRPTAQARAGATSNRPAKLLVIFNCQAEGLANCLEMVGKLRVDRYTHGEFRKRSTQILAGLDRYDFVLLASWVEKYYRINFPRTRNIMRLPVFNFGGYHPDHCNLTVSGGPLQGNFSMLSFAAFRLGVPQSRAIDLFNAGIYAQMGYLDHWEASRNAFVAHFKSAGIDLSRDLLKWSRHGPAAYIPTHPKIACLRDMARKILERLGLAIGATEVLPPDNLAKGADFPVYPEIGSRIGVQGSYLFKAPGSYRLIPLDEFLWRSYDFFRETAGVEVMQPDVKRFDHALQVISRMR